MSLRPFLNVTSVVARTLASIDRPQSAHLVVTRRCNLSCGYCNEFDHVSPPIPFAVLDERIAQLARLNTAAVVCTGGEPLLHPRMPDLVGAIRDRRMAALLITNGLPLTRTRIEHLNESGLQVLQISIDNLTPDAVSSKSLNRLTSRLRLLAEGARFHVNVNIVMGAGTRPADATEIARVAARHGFSYSVGLLHAPGGSLEPLNDAVRSAYRKLSFRSLPHLLNYWLFQRSLIEGRPSEWKCRAGARLLYVDEHGFVHWCSQRRDRTGIPLMEYGRGDIRRAFRTRKDCAPTCTLNCGHHASALDGWRRQDLPEWIEE